MEWWVLWCARKAIFNVVLGWDLLNSKMIIHSRWKRWRSENTFSRSFEITRKRPAGGKLRSDKFCREVFVDACESSACVRNNFISTIWRLRFLRLDEYLCNPLDFPSKPNFRTIPHAHLNVNNSKCLPPSHWVTLSPEEVTLKCEL